MLDVRYSTRFKKDFKTCVKRRWNMELLLYRTGSHADLFGI